MLRLYAWLSRFVVLLTTLGAGLLILEALWITWGVFARYVLHDPDELVTEATALLLMPLAFVGMAYALKVDAYPKVTLLVDKLPSRTQRFMHNLNLVLMILIGAFYTLVAGSAAVRSYQSGAAPAVIGWPEFPLWTAVAVCIGTFTLVATLKLIIRLASGLDPDGQMELEPEDKWSGMSSV